MLAKGPIMLQNAGLYTTTPLLESRTSGVVVTFLLSGRLASVRATGTANQATKKRYASQVREAWLVYLVHCLMSMLSYSWNIFSRGSSWQRSYRQANTRQLN